MNTVNYNDAEQLFGAVGTSLKKHTSEIADIVNVYGAKNLLPNERGSVTANGITATMNTDGSVSFSGTASATMYYNFTDPFSRAIVPSGSYKLFVEGQTSNCKVFINKYKGTTYVGTLVAGSTDPIRPFTVEYDSTYDGIQVGVVINNGATINTTIKAMITSASIEDDTYVPYAKSNKELTDDISSLAARIKAIEDTNHLTWG